MPDTFLTDNKRSHITALETPSMVHLGQPLPTAASGPSWTCFDFSSGFEAFAFGLFCFFTFHGSRGFLLAESVVVFGKVKSSQPSASHSSTHFFKNMDNSLLNSLNLTHNPEIRRNLFRKLTQITIKSLKAHLWYFLDKSDTTTPRLCTNWERWMCLAARLIRD